MQRQILKVNLFKNVLPIRKNVALYVILSNGKDAMMHSLLAQVSIISMGSTAEFMHIKPGWEQKIKGLSFKDFWKTANKEKLI